MLATIIRADGNTVDLHGSWATLWGSISGSFASLNTLLTTIGLLLVLASLVTYIFQRRRAGGGHVRDLGTVLWTLVAGSLLAAPNLLIPVFLTILDFVINGIAAAFSGAAGS